MMMVIMYWTTASHLLISSSTNSTADINLEMHATPKTDFKRNNNKKGSKSLLIRWNFLKKRTRQDSLWYRDMFGDVLMGMRMRELNNPKRNLSRQEGLWFSFSEFIFSFIIFSGFSVFKRTWIASSHILFLPSKLLELSFCVSSIVMRWVILTWSTCPLTNCHKLSVKSSSQG